jgi:hypothetical protein
MISIVSPEQGKKRDSPDDGGHRAVSGARIASPRQEGDHFDHGVIILITFVIKMITQAIILICSRAGIRGGGRVRELATGPAELTAAPLLQCVAG